MKKLLLFLLLAEVAAMAVAASSTQTPGAATRTTVGGAALRLDFNKASIQDATGNSTVAGLPIAVVQPVRKVDLTLTASTSWTYVYLTCTATPCDCTIWNPSAATINWILEPSTTAPTIPGAPLVATTGVLNVPVAPGLNYLWFNAASSVTGYCQLHY